MVNCKQMLGKVLALLFALSVIQIFSCPVFGESDLPLDIKEKTSNAIVLYVGSSKAYVKGTETQVDSSIMAVYPIVKNGRTLVPVRFISENFGASVDWNNKTKTVTAVLEGSSVKLVLGSKKIIINNEESDLDVPAQSINGRTMIPLRAMVEALGKEVFYESNLIVISDTGIIADQTDKQFVGQLIELFNEKGNTSGNLINGGLMAQDGEWIYYANTSDNNSLYKRKLDGTRETKLSYVRAVSINVKDNWVYYINPAEEGYSVGEGDFPSLIYRVKTDGTDESRVGTDEYSYMWEENLVIEGDWIYFTADGILHKVKLDGSSKTKLNDDSSKNLNIDNGWIYYSNIEDNYSIYKVKSDGSARTKLNDEESEYINVYNGWIYYTCDKKIYKIKTDGAEKTLVSGDDGRFLNVHDDWIYYSNYSDNRKLYKIKIDGTEKTKLSDDKTNTISIAGDSIYYYKGSSYGKIRSIKNDGTNGKRINEDNSNNISIQGEWIYYSNYSDDGRLYRIKTDGTGETKITDDYISTYYYGKYLQVEGDWIYYISGLDENRLYKIKTDGTERKRLTNDEAYDISILGSWIYYKNNSDEYKLYRVAKDGSENQRVFDDNKWALNITQDWILYCETDEGKEGLYRISAKDGAAGKLSDEVRNVLEVEDGWMYYANEYGIYRMKLENTEIVQSVMNFNPYYSDGWVNRIEVEGDWIYYTLESEYYFSFRKAKLDGSFYESILYEGFGFYDDINIIDDNIYFRDSTEDNIQYSIKTDGTGRTKIGESSLGNSRKGNINGNIVNGGLFAEQGQRIYFANSADENKLYRMKADGTGLSRISDHAVDSINVAGDWIYYSNGSDKGKLYRIRVDGSDETKLTDDSCDYVNLVGDWIYYTNRDDTSKIYKVKVDGTERTRITDHGGLFINVVNGWIYYRNSDDSYRIYKIRTDGTEKTLLDNSINKTIDRIGEPGESLVVAGEWIYYFNDEDNHSIYKMKMDGSDKTKLNDEPSWYMNIIYNSQIVYCNGSDKNTLYWMYADGTEKKKLSDNISTFVNIAGYNVYYISWLNDFVQYRTGLYDDDLARLDEITSVYEYDIRGYSFIDNNKLAKIIASPTIDQTDKNRIIKNIMDNIDSLSLYGEETKKVYAKNCDIDSDGIEEILAAFKTGYSEILVLIKWDGNTLTFYNSESLEGNRYDSNNQIVVEDLIYGGNKEICIKSSSNLDQIIVYRLGEYNLEKVFERSGYSVEVLDYDNDGKLEILKTDVTSPDSINFIQYRYFYKWNGEEFTVIHSDTIPSRVNAIGNKVSSITVDPSGEWIYISTDNSIYKISRDDSIKYKLPDAYNVTDMSVSGDWIYYTTNSTYDQALYKIKTDGSQNTLLTELSEDIYKKDIIVSVTDDWIYFYQATYKNGILYNNLWRIKSDGTSLTKLSDDYIYDAQIIDNWIYYSNSGNLLKMKSDGSEKVIINKNTQYPKTIFGVEGDYVYYYETIEEPISSNGYILKNINIYRVKSDGTNNSLLFSVDSCFYKMQKVGEGIYYSGYEGYINKINLDGTNKIQLANSVSAYFIVIDDWIYYIDSSSGNLMKMKLDGTQKTTIK